MADAQAVPADPVAGLIDIPLPPPVSLWPQTWTSRIAIAVILIVAVVGTWRFVHQRWVNRYRREALAELDQIERRLDEKSTFAELTATLAVLVRRTALAAFPREQVAALAGSAWLSFLDRSYGGADFSQGPGRALAGAPYQPAQPDDNELKPLLALVRRWITWPWALAALPLPLLAWWLLPPFRARQASVHVPFFERLAAATGQTPQQGAVILRRRSVQMIVAILVWVLIVLALARPQWVGDPITHEVSARDLILAVDISGSMDQSDFRMPNGQSVTRLAGVKQVMNDFIARRRGDRVALILFGTKAYVQVPFTQDLQTAQQLLAQTQVGMAGQQTAVGDTIGLSIKTFENSTTQQKLLILLTDGNDTASRVPPEHAADIAHQKGVVIYTVGFGDPNASGENRVDLGTLQAVAATTGGTFFRAEDGAQLEAIYTDIDKLAPAKVETQSWRPKLPLFQWPLGAALVLALSLGLLLLLGSELSRRRHPAHA